MITQINVGQGLMVVGSGTKPYISKTHNANPTHVTGEIRYDLDTQCFKVYDGSMWQTLYMSSPVIEFNAETTSLLLWAKKKMQQEKKIDELSDKYPAIKDAKEKLDVLMALIDEYKINQ